MSENVNFFLFSFINAGCNQIKERKRNQRKAKLFPDTKLRKNIPQHLIIGHLTRNFTKMFQSVSQFIGQNSVEIWKEIASFTFCTASKDFVKLQNDADW
jgi:hypothetical protein